MFDTAQNDQYPPGGGAAYAAYVDGGIGDQPNYSHIVQAFPGAHHLSIALFAGHDADALDVEPAAAGPGDIPGWYARQRRRGIDRPCIYANVSTMETQIIPVIRAIPLIRTTIRLWTAHYGEGEHICGPGMGTCGQLAFDADGTQWTSNALGRNLDQSLLRPDFFGTPQHAEFDMSKLPVLKQGDCDKPGQFWPVPRLQRLVALTGRINSLPAAASVIDDGVFGPATTAGVKAVQAHGGIAQDGVCGPATWSVLLTGSPA
jgi:hypothetical protein